MQILFTSIIANKSSRHMANRQRADLNQPRQQKFTQHERELMAAAYQECGNLSIGAKIILAHRGGMGKKRMTSWFEEQTRKKTDVEKVVPVKRNNTHHAKLMWREYYADPEGYVVKLEEGFINPMDGSVMESDSQRARLVESGLQRPGFLFKTAPVPYMQFPREQANITSALRSLVPISRQASSVHGSRFLQHQNTGQGANQRQLGSSSRRRSALEAMQPVANQYIHQGQTYQSTMTNDSDFGMPPGSNEGSNELPTYPIANDGSYGDMRSGGRPPGLSRFSGMQGNSVDKNQGLPANNTAHGNGYGSTQMASQVQFGMNENTIWPPFSGSLNSEKRLNHTQQPMSYLATQAAENQLPDYVIREDYISSIRAVDLGDQDLPRRRHGNLEMGSEQAAGFGSSSSMYAAQPATFEVPNNSLPQGRFEGSNIAKSVEPNLGSRGTVSSRAPLPAVLKPYVPEYRLPTYFKKSDTPPIDILHIQQRGPLNGLDQNRQNEERRRIATRSGELGFANKRKHNTIEKTDGRGHKRQRRADTIPMVVKSRNSELPRKTTPRPTSKLSSPFPHSSPGAPQSPPIAADFTGTSVTSAGLPMGAQPSPLPHSFPRAFAFTGIPVPSSSLPMGAQSNMEFPFQVPHGVAYTSTDMAQGSAVDMGFLDNYNSNSVVAAGLQAQTGHQYF
jgi:hypothetical protein